MSIWNKVLVGLVLVVALVFFYLAGRTLRIHRQWRAQAVDLQRQLKEEKARTKELDGGIHEPGRDPVTGVREAMLELYELTVDRGRVWRNARPLRIDAAKDPVEIQLAIDNSSPRVAQQSTLYIFDNSKTQRGWRYLGQFTVTGLDDPNNPKQFVAQPARKLSPQEIQRLQESQANQASWTMYEVMPVDDHELFAGWSEKYIRELFPDSTEDQYVKEADKRKLRDYSVSFREIHRQQSQLADSIAALNQDLQSLNSALAGAKQDEQARRNLIEQTKSGLAAAERELAAVEAQRKALEAELAAVQQRTAATLESNRSAVSQIARIQAEAIRRMDQKTATMAAVE